jgi:hypothetical protein
MRNAPRTAPAWMSQPLDDDRHLSWIDGFYGDFASAASSEATT